MYSKWIIDIEGMELYRFCQNGDLYKLPFRKGKRNYGLRKLKIHYPNRFLINGEFWSKRQLRQHIILDSNPVELTKTDKLPF